MSAKPQSLPLREVWLSRMRNFHTDCVSSAASEQAERIREAAWLLPRGHRFHPACPLSYNFHAIETMLALGAFESAVFKLIGEDGRLIVSRGGDGTCLASVILSDDGEEVIAEGTTPALALLAAHVSALVADCELGPAPRGSAPGAPASAH